MADPAPAAGGPARSPFSRALGYFPHVRRRFLQGLLCVVPIAAIDALAIPLIVRDLVDKMTDGTRPFDAADIAFWALGVVMILTLIKGAAKYYMRWWVVGASREFEQRYRQDLFQHLMTLTPQDLRHMRTGDVMSRSVADIEAVRMLLGPGAMYVAQSILVVPTVLVVMAVIDPVLTAALLIPFISLALVVKVAAKPTQRWSQASQERLGNLATVAQENFSGVRVVKAFATEAFSGSVFKRMGQAFLESNVRLASVRGYTHAAIFVVKDLGMLLIVLIGGWHLLDDRLTLGEFMLFAELLRQSMWPLIAIGWMLGMWHRGRAGAERLEELFAIRPSVTDAPDALSPVEIRGELQVRGLSHRWNGSAALDDVSFRVPAGSTLGVTGRTGSGKSTLVQLISRQIEPPAGAVLLDGHDVRELSLDHLRRSLGVVPQESFLFSESIRSNIGFAGDHVEEETIREMARAAHVEEDIEGFPSGYDQMLGERGVTLSGGQRQRTAIARTLAADPPLLILDDCLSAVDSVTERAILAGLRERLADRTAVIVSHRVAALSLADHIIVLDAGRIVEQGTHRELVAAGGLYADIHERQELEQEIEDL